MQTSKTQHTHRRFIAGRVVDVAMTAALFVLLSFSITGQQVHEWTGIAMLLLFIAHAVMNRAWYGHLFRGKYQAFRILQTVVDLLLFASFVVTAISGMLMSQYAVSFLRKEAAIGTARAVHLAFSHWTFLLISVHLGLHWGMMISRLQKKKGLWRILSAVAVLAAGYGMLLSIRAHIYSYMFFQVQFAFMDYGKTAAQVVAENALMMTSWVLPSYEAAGMLRRQAGSDPHRRWICLGMIAAEFALALVLSRILPAY